MFKIVSGSSENVENTENVENMEITKSPQMALQSQNGARNDQQFCRNQVWWLKGIEAGKTKIVNGKEIFDENGIRPVLIVSNNFVNRNGCKYITVVPCTSNIERENICTNVKFRNFKGIEQVLIINQMMNVEKTKLIGYYSTLDEDIMEKVEKAIRIQLGMENFEGDYVKQPLLEQSDFVEGEFEKEALKEPDFTEEALKETKQTEILNNTDLWDMEKWKKELVKGNINWSVNREIEFIKMYEQYGTKKLSKLIGMRSGTLATKIWNLRKKYPDIRRFKK